MDLVKISFPNIKHAKYKIQTLFNGSVTKINHLSYKISVLVTTKSLLIFTFSIKKYKEFLIQMIFFINTLFTSKNIY